MIKFKFKTELFVKEFENIFKPRLNLAMSKLAAKTQQEGLRIAKSKFGQKGLANWKRGFNVHKVSDDIYIISVDGKIANWMEDGIQTGEISRSIMSGNRAKFNQKTGRKYVDVPFEKRVTPEGTLAGRPDIHVRMFKDGSEMSAFFSKPKAGMPGHVVKEQRVVSRIEDIIKATNPKKLNTKQHTRYITIRRVTDNSVWPKTPFSGGKILDALSLFIDRNFDKILEEVM